MRSLALVASIVAATAALAQDGGPATTCQEKPTQSCVLDMAVEASQASGLPDGSLPYGAIVGTAVRSRRLDFALGLADHLVASDALALAATALVDAFARADRLEELQPFLKSRGETEEAYYFVVIPALIEHGRDAEAAARLAKIKPALSVEDAASLYALGHLAAGRSEAGVKSLEAIDDASKRERTAVYVSQHLVDFGRPEAARPLLPLLSGSNSFALMWRARLVQ